MNGIKTMWIAVAAVAAVALLIVGYAWGASRSNNASILSLGGGSYATGYAAGIAEAKKKLKDSGIVPVSPDQVTSISGTVKSVGTDRFIITANPVSMNPLDAQGPSERTIVVNDQTKITIRVALTPDELNAAMKAFQENIASKKPSVPPPPFTEKTASLSDIKIGMIVTITAADNIKDAATINATQVSFDAVSKGNIDMTQIPATGAPVLPPPVPQTK